MSWAHTLTLMPLATLLQVPQALTPVEPGKANLWVVEAMAADAGSALTASIATEAAAREIRRIM